MKSILRLSFIITILALVITGCQKSNDEIAVSLKSSATDVTTYDKWFPGGGASSECTQAGADCGFGFKIDEWDESFGMDGTYYTSNGNTIIISNSDGKTFDWKSEFPVCAVIVKAGTGALVYHYEGGAFQDEGLIGYKSKGISHVTFCYGNPQIVAVKAWYWPTYDFENNLPIGSDTWTVSTGFYPIEIGQWCDLLGINNLEVSSFTLKDEVGTVTIQKDVDSWKITIDLNDGMAFDRTALFIGSLDDLLSGEKDFAGCPNYYLWPYQNLNDVNTHVYTIPF